MNDEAMRILRRTSNKGLLRAYAALTHRMHVADKNPDRVAKAVELRTQRDHVAAEILRRME